MAVAIFTPLRFRRRPFQLRMWSKMSDGSRNLRVLLQEGRTALQQRPSKTELRHQLETTSKCFVDPQARVAARHEEQDITVGPSQSRSRIRLSMPVLNPSSLMQNGGLSSGAALERHSDEMDEEGSYLEPIRLQGPSHIWSPSSRPLSASSLISSGSSPISPPGNNMPSVLYANNDAVSVVPGASAVNEGPCLEAMMTEPVLPPPVAYANMDPSHYSNKLDDLLREEDESQHHLYINVGPEAVEVTSVYLRRLQFSSIRVIMTSQVKPRTLEPPFPLKQVNYVLLDLDKGSDSTTTASVTTHPLSPQGSVASFPESPHRTAASAAASAVTMATQTPLTVATAEGYATIDFDRTAALSNTVASSLTSEEEGLRKTRHNSTMAVTNARLLTLNRQTSSVSD